MKRSNTYQYALIALCIAIVALFSVFFYREVFPEYKIFQNAYVNLEKFRAKVSGVEVSSFKLGVKQIVIKEDTGPETIDRCTSCHVALQIQDFSPTQMRRDINGNIVRDDYGIPVKEPNPNYIWTKLDEMVTQYKQQGKFAKAEKLQKLKTANVEDSTYNMEKVLQMHPLIGKEERPFEYHPMDEYGCTSCHGGNGRALTVTKAHGPVYDDEYEISHVGEKPKFLELDPRNDPAFSRIFNHRPGHSLLFQTTPLLVGGLIEARCVQCHKPQVEELSSVVGSVDFIAAKRLEQQELLEKSLTQSIGAFLTYINLEELIDEKGIEKATEEVQKKSNNFALSEEDRNAAFGQYKLTQQYQDNLMEKLQEEELKFIGSKKLLVQLKEKIKTSKRMATRVVRSFIEKEEDNPGATGSLFKQLDTLQLDEALIEHFKETSISLKSAALDQTTMGQLESDIDRLTQHFQRGQQLYFSQACYACHRIAGLVRGGVGPELTESGLGYPWYLKESMVWPQADLKSSTMPNYYLDHEELEDLMTFLLAQRGQDLYSSEVQRKVALKAWEGGQKLDFEMPIDLKTVKSVEAGMWTFAMEGCAACHKLEGYTSSVGFTIEKEKPSFKKLYAEEEWFKNLIPEDVGSSVLVRTLEMNIKEINQRISNNVRDEGMLDEIEAFDPLLLPAFYAPFKYAFRANQTDAWQDLVKKVMMVYYQQYGLGRLVGPRPNWSGVYHSDQWLMEHFWNPQSHVPKTIMPVMPFDNTKFWQLTYMLDVLGKQNRDKVRQIWDNFGFKPQVAYDIFCAQCHGDQLKGNGPVAEWIYPIPKNLRSADFLRNLTKERAKESIVHGVKGTPMAPWGEVWKEKGEGYLPPVITEQEAEKLVEWMYELLPGGTILKDVPKWEYTPEDFLEELKKEGSQPKLSTEPAKASFFPFFATIDTSDIFKKVESPAGSTDENYYYIKKKYYTKENLEAGQKLFLLHCSMCHGTEADGSGERSETMEDAKPRMLTNLDWIGSRDDLRLLRSIKYGVPGTSMTAFGDTTAAFQRMQLVVYIRELSREPKERKDLKSKLYQIYSKSEQVLIDALSENEKELSKKEGEVKQLKKLLSGPKLLTEGDESGGLLQEKYQIMQSLEQQVTSLKKKKKLLFELKTIITEEQEIRFTLGNILINKEGADPIIDEYIELVSLEQEHYVFEDGELKAASFENREKKQKAVYSEIVSFVKDKVDTLDAQIEQVDTRMASKNKDQALEELQADRVGWDRIQKEIISSFSENQRMWTKQMNILEEINELGNDRNVDNYNLL